MVRDERPLLVEVEVNPGKANRARLNRSPVPRAREVVGLLRTVLFAPEDLALVKGDPSERRRFLDDLLVARAPRLAGVRADYDRILKQRNALLKSAGYGSEVPGHAPTCRPSTSGTPISPLPAVSCSQPASRWSPTSSRSLPSPMRGSRPAAARPESTYQSALGADAVRVPDRIQLAAALLEAMQASRKAELERGVSLVGPHRDELRLDLGSMPAKGFASHGESWSFALALRLAAYDLLTSDGGEPVLILDDVFAELDTSRRDRLADLVAPAEQVLLTAAVPEDVPLALRGTRFDVTAGAVHRAA